jgi:hypothetical protein
MSYQLSRNTADKLKQYLREPKQNNSPPGVVNSVDRFHTYVIVTGYPVGLVYPCVCTEYNVVTNTWVDFDEECSVISANEEDELIVNRRYQAVNYGLILNKLLFVAEGVSANLDFLNDSSDSTSSSTVQIGCGLIIEDNILKVDLPDFAGEGLSIVSTSGCDQLTVDTDTVVENSLNPDGGLTYNSSSSSGATGLSVNVGCNLQIVDNKVIVDVDALAGTGLTIELGENYCYRLSLAEDFAGTGSDSGNGGSSGGSDSGLNILIVTDVTCDGSLVVTQKTLSS